MRTSPSSFPALALALRQRLPRRGTVVAFVGGIALAAGGGALAAGHGFAGARHCSMSEAHGAADVSAHVDHMLKHFYAEIDATEAQKARIDPLVKQAASELMPLHQQFHSPHRQALGLLGAAPDRAALENFRASQIQVMDQASRRLTQLIAEVSDVLTPAQRKTLADRIAEHHGMGRG